AAAYSLLTDRPAHPVRVTAPEIMARYAPGTKATDDTRCLACHTNPALAHAELVPDPTARALREQGVGCEACHGNAGRWLQPHTALKTADRKRVFEETGLVPLSDIGDRALACAGCHVGAPAGNGLPVRDMNHDMIAAGHPRLNFDFAEYQRRLPQHWEEKDRSRAKPNGVERNEAKAWYVGRVAHAEAACRLLEDRARRADANAPRTPWPEFAEFNCASCHHSLRVPNDPKRGDWRTSDAYLGGRPIGVPPWQMIWPLTSAAGLEAPARDAAPLAAVVKALEVPKPAKNAGAIPAAGEGAKRMGDLRRALVAASDAEVEKQARALFPTGAPLVPEWDSASQLFFGLAALEHARGKPDAPTVARYQAAVQAFRAQDWATVETAFGALRSK
ncbi:MAG: multiheme c-type cytochrome, partial [Gemmata sp.]